MPIAFNPRGRVDRRNRPGSGYYAALYEDDSLEPGALSETGIHDPGILSHIGFDNAAEQEFVATGPVPGSGLAPGVDVDDARDTGQAMAPAEGSSSPSAVFSPLGDLFYQESANSAAPTGKSTVGNPTIGHAGDLESLIPFWGAGRNLLADLEEGDYAGAALNGALLASDFFLLGAPAKFIAKAALTGARKSGLKGALESSKYAVMGPIGAEKAEHAAWKHVRGQMGKHGMLEKYQHGHHWALHRNEGLGKYVPDVIKNHPWNIMGMPKALSVHGRLHGPYKGLPEYNPFQKYWHGKPGWFKTSNAEMIGRPVEMIFNRSDR